MLRWTYEKLILCVAWAYAFPTSQNYG